ncbi:hypothetical protein KL86CLO1_13131 [uncultured Eubacteriales bacterium]|uniref:Uncharacterized protein n=1 Tax=uncultured Eubacteriales bacterium TaxID=172733 RepID=A0A212KHA6_9FIRM|nr:hypothetical protein KL86CLO1_13131 [uncultured Eubacteriales bacterium]
MRSAAWTAGSRSKKHFRRRAGREACEIVTGKTEGALSPFSYEFPVYIQARPLYILFCIRGRVSIF